jgi:hypothetical protein
VNKIKTVIQLSQKRYALDLLKRAGIANVIASSFTTQGTWCIFAKASKIVVR